MSKKIEVFTRETIGEFRQDLERVLSELGEEYGVTFNLGKASFNQDEFHFKSLTAMIGTASDKFDEFMKAMAPELVGAYGKKIIISNKEYIISSFLSNSPKNFVGIKDANGTGTYTCNAYSAISGLKEAVKRGIETEITKREVEAKVKEKSSDKSLEGLNEAKLFFHFFEHIHPKLAGHYGSRIVIKKTPYTISGFNPRARKNSVIIKHNNGTEYSMNPIDVLNFIVE